jgi:hypothetical protein
MHIILAVTHLHAMNAHFYGSQLLLSPYLLRSVDHMHRGLGHSCEAVARLLHQQVATVLCQRILSIAICRCTDEMHDTNHLLASMSDAT